MTNKEEEKPVEKKEELKPEPEEKDEAEEAKPMKDEGKPLTCPKCEKMNLLSNADGVYCRICGRIGSVDEIEKIFRDKREAKEKSMADHHMPSLPKKIGRNTAHSGGAVPNPLLDKLDEIIKYVEWLGKHFRKEDNFICKCGKHYSPKKAVCPACFPTGPGRKA